MKIKIDLIKYVKENPLVTAMAAVLIAAILVYLVIFVPVIRQLQVKYTECRVMESQIADAQNLIAYADKIDSSCRGRVLVSERDAAQGLDEFTAHAKSLGVNFISMKPGDIIMKEGGVYKILPVELEIKTTGKQLVDFMGSIDELKKVIVTVDSFNITPDKEMRDELDVDMVINIYLSAKDGAA